MDYRNFGNDLENYPVTKNLSSVNVNCPIHGNYHAFKANDHITGETYISKCPKCEAERIESEREKVATVSQDPEVKFRRRLETAGIPINYLDSTFDNFTVSGYGDPRHSVKQEFTQFLDTDKMNFVILGSTGVGKTHLGCALVRAALLRGMSAMYVKEGVLLRQIKATFGRRDIVEQDIIDRYARYKILVIDELGLSPWTEYNAQAITDIIDDRANNRNKTIYMGNMDVETFKKHFNDQCLSRINSREIVMALNTDDYRRKL